MGAAVALIVNGEYVADELFLEEFRLLGGETVDASRPESVDTIYLLRQRAEQQVLRRVVLRKMALQSGVSVSEDAVEAERRRRWGSTSNTTCGAGVWQALRVELMIQQFCKSLTRHVLRPSRVEVEQFYRANPAKFAVPERVQAAHIVRNVQQPEEEAEARQVLEQAAAELASGMAFARVADRYSDCHGVGGALGWVARGEMVKEFEDVVFSLKTGERSPIFRTVFGLHIATVLGRRAAGLEPLEQVRQPLARSLLESRKQRMIEDAVTLALAKAQITTARAEKMQS